MRARSGKLGIKSVEEFEPFILCMGTATGNRYRRLEGLPLEQLLNIPFENKEDGTLALGPLSLPGQGPEKEPEKKLEKESNVNERENGKENENEGAGVFHSQAARIWHQ